ncbi:murein L,D-transpeptidase YafK [Angulomicrobium tetraedrale]|uniref:Murein L,D-transpeptidase YafK n=1 Tax=Ancylobacter tetraedralis TaxID=217068 RepID=A0A839ZEU6_9HYPH|nr:murein L,D-transpeptidase family protein [Ancylobacter tetraedralis]MBB3773343.1 murein L,D-transpeptidase YafK [Ancylobacter tetraedralis]
MVVKLLARWGLLAALVLSAGLAGCVGDRGDDRGSVPLNDKIVSEMTAKGMTPADPILIRIYKQESELEVWKRTNRGTYALLKTYPMCRWSGKLGPKTQEGDRQAPEGFYTITPAQLNPRSQFYLSFNLGYPNPLESALGYTGSALMVHGACTSAGCYAMTNNGVAEIYALGREALKGGQQSFPVQALPFRMTPANFAAHRNDPNVAFWRNLKEGVDYFNLTRQPPVVSACGGRYRFTPAGSPAEPGLDPLGPCPAEPVVEPTSVEIVQRVQQREVADFAEAAAIASVNPELAGPYVDGGMHPMFRDVLRRGGPEKLASLTSGQVPVSQPDAALADPYRGAETASAEQ